MHHLSLRPTWYFLTGLLLSSCSQSALNTVPAAAAAPSHNAPAIRTTGTRVDSLNGIPGHRFGEPLSAFPGLRRARDQQPGVRCYNYSPGTAAPGWFGKHQKEIPAVFYVFKDGKFASFQAIAFGPGKALLREEAVFLFGPGQVGVSATTWEGAQVTASYAQQYMKAGMAEMLTVDSRALLAAQAEDTAARLKAENAVQ